MSPHLVKWHQQYSEQGLVVIDVFNGPADRQFGLGIEAIREHIKHERIQFPVLYDADATTCNAYAVQGYPSRYLIGRDGRVLWQDCWGNKAKAERMIQKALERGNKKQLSSQIVSINLAHKKSIHSLVDRQLEHVGKVPSASPRWRGNLRESGRINLSF